MSYELVLSSMYIHITRRAYRQLSNYRCYAGHRAEYDTVLAHQVNISQHQDQVRSSYSDDQAPQASLHLGAPTSLHSPFIESSEYLAAPACPAMDFRLLGFPFSSSSFVF